MKKNDTNVELRPPLGPARKIGRTDGARLLDLRGAATYVGISYWTLRELIFAGTIPTVKIPAPRAGDGRPIRRVLVDRLDLDEFIEDNKESEQP